MKVLIIDEMFGIFKFLHFQDFPNPTHDFEVACVAQT
jgi:hypothetical protein